MTLRLLAVALLIWGLSCGGSEPRRGRGSDARPNILLLTAEDLSSRIGAFGDAVARTPNLDRLASEGVRYPNTFTTSGVCATSRAALMTGVRQTALGAQHMRAGRLNGFRSVPPPKIKAFPELLRAAGYFTFVTEKLDYQFSSTMPGSGPFTIWDRETFRYADWSGTPTDRPFYGQINYGVTHESGIFPYGWPKSLVHAAVMVMRLVYLGGVEHPTDPLDVELPPYLADTPTARRDLARHYDNIIKMDEAVGATLQALERDGLADSTIVIWTTDHGDGLPRAKRELFDSGMRVPMIIRWPEKFRPTGLALGQVEERLVSFVDLAATILALAGVEVPKWMDGQVFAGPNSDPPRSYVFASRDRLDESLDRQRAIRDQRYKYIRNYHPGTPGHRNLAFRHIQDISAELRDLYEAGKLDAVQRRWFEPRPADELYDTWDDPPEVVNLAGEPQHAETLARMRAALDSWMDERPDLGEMDEKAMIEKYWPGGEQPVTDPPQPRIARSADATRVALVTTTEGASIGYRLGTDDDDTWLLYTEPLRVKPGTEIEAKAVRYGWEESEVSIVTAD